MADTTKSVARDRQEPDIVEQKIAASSKVVAGILVNFNASKYVKSGSDTSGEEFAGVSMAEVDNTTGSDGDKLVPLWQDGDFIFTVNGGVTIADLGATVYVYDNQTVAKTTTNSVECGKIAGIVSSTQARIRISVLGA